MVRAFRSERLIVIFPSGRLARPTLRGLVERGWTPTAVNLAQKYRCPIVPMHIRGRNSWLYYLLYAINTELKDMTLFRELLNKTGQPYRIRIAEPFDPHGLGHPWSHPDPRVDALQRRVQAIAERAEAHALERGEAFRLVSEHGAALPEPLRGLVEGWGPAG